jgi:hypothetical protein
LVWVLLLPEHTENTLLATAAARGVYVLGTLLAALQAATKP